MVTYFVELVWLIQFALAYFALFYFHVYVHSLVTCVCACIFISCVSLVRVQAGSGEDAGEAGSGRQQQGEFCGSRKLCRGAQAGTGLAFRSPASEGSVSAKRDKSRLSTEGSVKTERTCGPSHDTSRLEKDAKYETSFLMFFPVQK